MTAVFRNNLIFATLLCVFATATPALSDGFYAGLSGGISQTTDSSISGTGINASAEFEPGGIAVLSLGYGYDNGFRSEIELGGRWSDADSISNSTARGDVKSISAMVNGLIDISTDTSFTPYFGGGCGHGQC